MPNQNTIIDQSAAMWGRGFIPGHFVPLKPSNVRHQDIRDCTMFTTETTRTFITYLSTRFHKVNSNAKSLIANKPETIQTQR
jgi:hypothetical protein